jgi:predicted nucleotide-binding protein (sugar kinase/HSP70/actin superfamily)
MKIGIPRGLLYHYYGDLWLTFFNELGIKTVLSPETNKAIMKMGSTVSVDEACFSSKVFLGHVAWLENKCDMVFVPRMENAGLREDFCPRIIGSYDLVRHTFPKLKLLHSDTNFLFRKRETDAYVKIGEQLGFDAAASLAAYQSATEKFNAKKLQRIAEQDKIFSNTNPRVLIVSHAYNTYDAMIGKDILDYFKTQKIDVVFADVIDEKSAKSKTRETHGQRIYWRVNSILLGGVETYKDRVDGIVLITTFPCGPDSIFNEMIIRTVKDKPILSLMVDELDASAGIITRLESFTDIIAARRAK